MLTPLEIENKKFSKQMMNGYNVDEVDEFLDLLTVDYERLYKEGTEAKEKLEQLNDDLAHYKTIENTLQSTLMMAQSTAEEVKNVARQQAEQIINDAQANARQEIMNLEQEILLKKKELEDAAKQFDIYKAKMESLLISQLELLKDVNKD
ncbi:MAG: DivIVA domain-containing protein [Clostridia bacterium]|nr:DivIVA domain-containing protein [Clostridia bacterium]